MLTQWVDWALAMIQIATLHVMCINCTNIFWSRFGFKSGSWNQLLVSKEKRWIHVPRWEIWVWITNHISDVITHPLLKFGHIRLLHPTVIYGCNNVSMPQSTCLLAHIYQQNRLLAHKLTCDSTRPFACTMLTSWVVIVSNGFFGISSLIKERILFNCWQPKLIISSILSNVQFVLWE